MWQKCKKEYKKGYKKYSTLQFDKDLKMWQKTLIKIQNLNFKNVTECLKKKIIGK